jgi:hypothetical protein
MPAMHRAFRAPATLGQTSAPRRFASSRRNSDSRARLTSPSGPSACGRAASPSAATTDAERGGVLNTARSATSRPCSTSLSDSAIERFCTFVGARNVPQWRRAASFSSFLFRLFCAARFASARCSLGVDASPSPSRRTMCVASLAPLANPVAVLLPENVRSAVEGGYRSSNRALADTPRISSAGVSFATTSVGPNFRWVACAWSGPATASCATSSTALRVEARDERRSEGPGGFIVLRGRRGRGVSCQRARRNTRNTGSTDRRIRHVLWRERTPGQAPKRTPRARVFVSIAASRALSTMGRESSVVAVAGARRGACGGQASRRYFSR